MKRSILIAIMSLQAFCCFAQAQVETTDLPVADYTVQDTSLVTDLVSSIRENTKIQLNWSLNKNHKVDFITVERSNGGNDFEVVAVIKQTGNEKLREWIDDAPPKGRNLYRLRFPGIGGKQAYSAVVAAMIAGDTSFKFYPNPVDNILIIRTDTPLDVQVLDGTGKVRISQNGVQGLQTINVATLEKGLYFLRVNNRASGVMTQEKLLKN